MQEVNNPLSVDRELLLRRPGQKTIGFWMRLMVRSRDRATRPTCEDRRRQQKGDYQAALPSGPRHWRTKQQAGAGPVTAEATGSGSAAAMG